MPSVGESSISAIIYTWVNLINEVTSMPDFWALCMYHPFSSQVGHLRLLRQVVSDTNGYLYTDQSKELTQHQIDLVCGNINRSCMFLTEPNKFFDIEYRYGFEYPLPEQMVYVLAIVNYDYRYGYRLKQWAIVPPMLIKGVVRPGDDMY